MKRSIVLTLGLLAIPTFATAQVEIGIDAGLSIESIDDVDDNVTSFSIPSGVRLGFGAGESVLVESRVAFERRSQGDVSITALGFVPGINFLVGEQLYLRGEAGLSYLKLDSGTDDGSVTQYMLGGAAGLRIPVRDNVLFRPELGVVRFLENTDDGIPANWEFRLQAGISAVIN
jgi:hypothetical protein